MHIRPAVVAAAVLLLMMFVLAGGAALRESVTIDEVAHIGAGLSYVQKLDLRLNDEHPPLAKVLAGLALAIRGTHADYSSVQWNIGKEFFPAYMGEWVFGDWVLGRWNDAQSTLMWARLPMLLLTVLLGWVLFVLGRRLGGDWGGLLCLAAYTSMPAFLAFGPLVLTDVAIALFTVLTLATLGELWRNPDRRNTRWFALALAGALLSKFSSGILFPAVLAFVLSTRWWALADQPAEKDPARVWRKFRWRALRKATMLAGVVVYVVYFVFSWNQPLAVPGFAGHGPLVALAGRLLMPPWLFLRGLGWVLLTAVRPSFLFGHPYPHGVWFFYPVLLVLKSLPGFLGLLVLTLALSLWHRWKHRDAAVLPAELATHWAGSPYKSVWVPPLAADAQPLMADLLAQIDDALGQERAQLLLGAAAAGKPAYSQWGKTVGGLYRGTLFTVCVNPDQPDGLEYGQYQNAVGGGGRSRNRHQLPLFILPEAISSQFFDPWLAQMGITNTATTAHP